MQVEGVWQHAAALLLLMVKDCQFRGRFWAVDVLDVVSVRYTCPAPSQRVWRKDIHTATVPCGNLLLRLGGGLAGSPIEQHQVPTRSGLRCWATCDARGPAVERRTNARAGDRQTKARHGHRLPGAVSGTLGSTRRWPIFLCLCTPRTWPLAWRISVFSTLSFGGSCSAAACSRPLPLPSYFPLRQHAFPFLASHAGTCHSLGGHGQNKMGCLSCPASYTFFLLPAASRSAWQTNSLNIYLLSAV